MARGGPDQWRRRAAAATGRRGTDAAAAASTQWRPSESESFAAALARWTPLDAAPYVTVTPGMCRCDNLTPRVQGYRQSLRGPGDSGGL